MKVKFFVFLIAFFSLGMNQLCYSGGDQSKGKDPEHQKPITPPRRQALTTPLTIQLGPDLTPEDIQQIYAILNKGKPTTVPPQAMTSFPNTTTTNSNLRPIQQDAPKEKSTVPQTQPATAAITTTPIESKVPSNQTSQLASFSENSERALVPYQSINFKGVLVPHPKTAVCSIDSETATMEFRSDPLCSIYVLSKDNAKKNKLVEELQNPHNRNVKITSESARVWHYLNVIYDDLKKIGQKKQLEDKAADELIETIRHLAQTHKLDQLYQSIRWQRDTTTLQSRVLIELPNNVIMILSIDPLPNSDSSKNEKTI